MHTFVAGDSSSLSDIKRVLQHDENVLRIRLRLQYNVKPDWPICSFLPCFLAEVRQTSVQCLSTRRHMVQMFRYMLRHTVRWDSPSDQSRMCYDVVANICTQRTGLQLIATKYSPSLFVVSGFIWYRNGDILSFTVLKFHAACFIILHFTTRKII